MEEKNEAGSSPRETEIEKDSFFGIKEDNTDNLSLVKRPPRQSLASSAILMEHLEKFSFCKERAESLPGFSEFRKYKKANESRIIKPYEPREDVEKSVSKHKNIFPEIEIKDARKFLLDTKEPIPVTDFRTIIELVGRHPDIGYVTMNRQHMDLVNDYKPYNYTICHYSDVDKSNYVTISPNGLVEFYKEDADFLSLDRLEVEYDLFNKLKEMPSFQSFCVWKSFMVWFRKIKRRKFMNAKEKIEHFFVEKYKNVGKT